MTRRKLFSLIPAGLLTALVPSFFKKNSNFLEPPNRPLYNEITLKELPKIQEGLIKQLKNDEQYGPWELFSIQKDKFEFVSGPKFLTMAEGWAWIDSLYFYKDYYSSEFKICSYDAKLRWIRNSEQECKEWIASLRLIGCKKGNGKGIFKYQQKLESRA